MFYLPGFKLPTLDEVFKVYSPFLWDNEWTNEEDVIEYCIDSICLSLCYAPSTLIFPLASLYALSDRMYYSARHLWR